MALKSACIFASIFKVNKPAGEMQNELQIWWEEIGEDLLWGKSGEVQVGEDDGEGEEEACEEEDLIEDQAVVEAQELESNLANIEKQTLIEQELVKMPGNPPAADADPATQNASDEIHEAEDDIGAFSDDDEKEEVERVSGTLFLNILTLEDLLNQHGLSDFAPVKDLETELGMFKRIRPLLESMRKLVTLVRLKEGVLKKPVVVGMRVGENAHNSNEHSLALARMAFQCFAQNQSRQALWQGFNERVVLDIKEEKGDQEGCKTIESAGCLSDRNNGRSYQLFVARPFQAGEGESGGLRVGLVVGVWRHGRNKKQGSTSKLFPDGRIPFHCVSKVHLLLLNTWIEEPEEVGQPKKFYLVGSFLGFALKTVCIFFYLLSPLLTYVALTYVSDCLWFFPTSL